MRRLTLLVAALLPAALAAQKAPAVRYDVSFPNAAHHEAAITVEFTAVPAGTLALRMSRSSPGRYALHEFAKNVYGVTVVDGTGKPLKVTRPNPHQWNVATTGGTVKVSYILFGNLADGTYAGINEAHAHLNAPATFMWARGFDARPVSVTFHPRDGWSIATQLARTADSLTFTAPHLQYLMDSPVMLGPLTTRTWTATHAGQSAQFRMALDHQGTAAEADKYAAGLQRIVSEAAGVWGTFPAFDFGEYTFLAAYLPWAGNDGMEHRNSTSLTNASSLATDFDGLLAVASHEFFHAWNVERLRPKSLEPFDLTDANPSQELWIAEGFTSYYDALILARAGLTTPAAFVRGIGANADAALRAPGRRWFSVTEMSEQAPLVDAAASIDPTNRANTYLSYYTWGAAIGLALDLSLRARHDTLSLDTFMRAMWRDFGQAQLNFAPAKPYRVDDARRVLGRVAGDTIWANDFFARFVTGRALPDYAPLLARAGVVVRRAAPGKAWMGDTRWRAQGGQLVAASPVLQGTPLYDLNVETGDRLAQIDGRAPTRPAQIDSILATHKPGDRIPVVIIARGRSRELLLTLVEDPRIEFVAGEDAGQPPTAAQLAFRQRWLASARKD